MHQKKLDFRNLIKSYHWHRLKVDHTMVRPTWNPLGDRSTLCRYRLIASWLAWMVPSGNSTWKCRTKSWRAQHRDFKPHRHSESFFLMAHTKKSFTFRNIQEVTFLIKVLKMGIFQNTNITVKACLIEVSVNAVHWGRTVWEADAVVYAIIPGHIYCRL